DGRVLGVGLGGEQGERGPAGLDDEARLAGGELDVATVEQALEALGPAAVGALMAEEPGDGPANGRVLARHARGEQAVHGEEGAVGEVDAPKPEPAALGVLGLQEEAD